MPIKYQMLGGGGGQTLIITTNPNAQVTLSNDKYSKTITTDEHGRAEFKGLKDGVYTVVAKTEEGNVQKEILISSENSVALFATKPLRELALGEKIMFSSGKSFLVQAKNVTGFPSDSVTLVSEYVTEETNVGFTDGLDQVREILNGYYLKLSIIEKGVIINHSYTLNVSPEPAYFYIASKKELQNGGVLGFSNNESRIKYDKNGTPKQWFTATRTNPDNIHYTRTFVLSDGSLYNTSGMAGVVPFCNLKDNTLVYKRSDGYWVITE